MSSGTSTIREVKRRSRKTRAATNIGLYLLAVEAWNRTPRGLRWFAGLIGLGLIVTTIAYWYVVLPLLGTYMAYRAYRRVSSWWSWRRFIRGQRKPGQDQIPL